MSDRNFQSHDSSDDDNHSPSSRGSSRRSREDHDEHSEAKEQKPGSGPLMFILIFLIIMVLYFYKTNPSFYGSSVEYSFFRDQLNAPADPMAEGNDQSNIEKLEFVGQRLIGTWKTIPTNPEPDGSALSKEFNTVQPSVEDRQLIADLRRQKVPFKAKDTTPSMGGQLMMWLIGPLLLIGFFWFMMRRSSDPMSSGMMGNFIKSNVKEFEPTEGITTFEDVAGMKQAKRELMEIVDFLKNPEKYEQLGAQIPKGVLLMGPPGNGKTLLARATAGEAEVPFYSINGSEFIQMFVGVGASRVRDLFDTAAEHSPSIVFIDEIDAVGRVRGAGVGGGHDEREQTLNQILSEMDGFEQTASVIVMAATNRPDVLDPALLRPGRFDRHITIDRPSKTERLGILKVHSRKVPLDDEVNLKEIAQGTIGFSGADLKNLVNEAALFASRDESRTVKQTHFDQAQDRILMGPAREEILNQHEKEMTAYHEAGHALLAWLIPDLDPVHKVTIVPRGRALGVTQLLPDDERYNIGEKRLHSQLAMMLAGRAAEKLFFNEYSAGAEDDIKRATSIARKMVAHWGMSETIGPVAFRQGEEHPFLGKEMHEHREFSEDTARIIDQEVQQILLSAAERATSMLVENRDLMNEMVNELLDHETLDQEDLIQLLGKREEPERYSPLERKS